MDIIVGTAGHIDHGKTALVKALTGVDADRLPEEKQRGITIDLGFAELSVGDVHLGFVDVPGHERFVKNMLAGAGGIDLVLMVIAADEGVMPQTREHFDICRLLETQLGMIVLTKADLVDEETLELARLEAESLVQGSFLDNSPIVSVSSKTGSGIENLKRQLVLLSSKAAARSNELVARLPVDRSFSVKGFGTVVTGTLLSGAMSEGDELDMMPAGRRVRVRGLQTHGSGVKHAQAGRRLAINLGGIDHDEIGRGDVLAEPGALRASQIMNAEVEVLSDAARAIRTRQRVRFHIGSAEVLGRATVIDEGGEIAPGAKGYVQMRLESPIAAIRGEHFIIRSYSPQTTIAGGRVLDPLASKIRSKDLPSMRQVLAGFASARTLEDAVRLFVAASRHGISLGDLRAKTGAAARALDITLQGCLADRWVVAAGDLVLSAEAFETLSTAVLNEIAGFHISEPLARGIAKETLRERVFRHTAAGVFAAVIEALERDGKIVTDRDVVRATGHDQELSAEDRAVYDNLVRTYHEAGLEVPKLEDALSRAGNGPAARTHTRKIFQMLVDSGRLTKVTDEFYIESERIARLAGSLREYAAGTSDRLIDVAAFKNVAGVSRKFAIPLLEYFDRERITRRAGDKRIVL